MITPAPLQDPDDIKVFILYLLNRVGYPLKYDRVADIVVQDGMSISWISEHISLSCSTPGI